VAELDRAARRLAAFAPAEAGPGSSDATLSGPTLDDSRALVMRALRTVSAPAAALMLRHICTQPADSRELAQLTGLPRLATWEEISDLVQVGLAERDLERDLVRPTPAGRALVELVDEISDAAWAEATR
jgi:hypothetical protein